MPPSPNPPATQPEPLHLPEREAQLVLLVRAFEEADAGRDFLTRADRRRATAEAAEEGQPLGEFLTARAHVLEPILRREAGSLPGLLGRVRLLGALPWILWLCFVLGLGANLLGPEKSINVVANPLAGLLAWNLAVYLLLLLSAFAGLRRGARSPRTSYPLVARLTGLVSAGWRASARSERDGARARLLAAALTSFLGLWNQAAGALLLQRLRFAFHLAAGSMVLGALLGMYARGLLFEYLATWESTFLGPEQVARWFEFLLGPASALSGIPIPDVELIQRDPGGAAPWIHLYALSTVLVVLLPRSLLAFWAQRQSTRLARAVALDADAPYFQRLRLSGGGEVTRTRLLPYSYSLDAERGARLKALMFDLLGARAEVELFEPTPYGEEPAILTAGTAPEGELFVLLFSLAQTPESEVHGHLVELLRAHVRQGGRGLVLVDAARWNERSSAGESQERRRAEKRRAWDRVLREAGFTAVHVDLDGTVGDEELERLGAGLQPGRGLEEAG